MSALIQTASGWQPVVDANVQQAAKWQTTPSGVLPALPPWRSVYPFYAGPSSIWRKRVDDPNLPLDPNSANICAYLRSKLTVTGLPGDATTTIYVVDGNQPMVPVNVASGFYSPNYAADAPIPTGAITGKDSDHYMTVVQKTPSAQNHRAYEFWTMTQNASGQWSCGAGHQRMHILTSNPGYSRQVQDANGNYLEEAWWGPTASKLALTGGVVQLAEIQEGYIGHALQMVVPWSRQGQWSFPAQATDGRDSSTYSIPYGAHFRIDPTIDLTQFSATMSPYVLMFARAAQEFGILVYDQTGSSVGIMIEDPGNDPGAQQAAATGGPPVHPPAQPDYNQYFPWDHLQLLPLDLRTAQDMTGYVEKDDTDT